MSSGFKDNSLACGLLGFIIGSSGTLVGQAIINQFNANRVKQSHPVGLFDASVSQQTPKKDPTNFDKVPYDPDGEYVITEGGKKYHYERCYTLKKSSKLQRVNSVDAEAAGLTACCKCVN